MPPKTDPFLFEKQVALHFRGLRAPQEKEERTVARRGDGVGGREGRDTATKEDDSYLDGRIMSGRSRRVRDEAQGTPIEPSTRRHDGHGKTVYAGHRRPSNLPRRPGVRLNSTSSAGRDEPKR